MNPEIKSPLRYPGGKSRAIRQILSQFPAAPESYREPFAGGASVFLATKQRYSSRIKQYWINDLNFDLFCFWKTARDENARLCAAVMEEKARFPKGRELYLRWLDEGGRWNDFERGLRFFIMNRITFSGTVDSGGYSQSAYENRFTDSSIERLRRLEASLHEVKITHEDYEALLHDSEKAFIFLDPPYYSATTSRLYGKKGDLHTGFDHLRFADQIRQCPHEWLITYDDSPEVRENFSFATLVEWTLQYGMNNYKQDKAASGKELFIRNY